MNQGTPKIGIYTSCYNHEKYVAQAIDSVIAQTYENWEFYVVNDGSTDRSGKIIASYTDRRILYYDFKENTNFAGALVFLWDVLRDAEVDYIACIATDDMWKPDKLEKQIEIFHKYPEYKLCLTWDKIIFSTQNKGFYEGKTSYSHKRNRSRFEWLSLFFDNGNCLNQCSFLMPKQVFFELGAFNPYLRQLGDFHMWCKVAAKHPMYLIEEELTYYRRHDSNLSEPNDAVCLRDANEQYQILKDVILPMDKELFHRAFYARLPYAECETDAEFAAEKFIFLLSTNNYIKQQVAMDLFFENCGVKAFIEVLKKRYLFRERDLLNLTGGGGLVTAYAASLRKTAFFTPVSILLNAINTQQLTAASLSAYRYSMILDLWNVTSQFQEGKEQFHNVKDFIMALQDARRVEREKTKILFLIAENSPLDCSKLIQEKCEEGAICYAAFVPTIADAMHRPAGRALPDGWPKEVEILLLYDGKEHCLHFLHELSKEADCIYYIDCLDSNYECSLMAAGYPLSAECYGILREEIYQRMMENQEIQILEMMREILTY